MNSLSLTPNRNIFFEIKNINSPLNKKYKILPYSQQIIKNENNIFDLIYYKGNPKKYNYLKNLYTTEQNNIKREILIQSKKDKKYKNSNIINIKTFDADKINIHSAISILEGNLISGLINYLKNKKSNQAKMVEYKRKNKFVFKRPSLTLKENLGLNKFFNKNKNNFFTDDKKDISNNTSINKNENEELNNESKMKFNSIYNILDENIMDIKTKNELQKTMNTFYSSKYRTLNKDKKYLSSDNFFGIQSKKIKIKGTKEQKLNLRRKKLSKLLFSKLFKEENKIMSNLNEINNDLIDFKNSNNFNISDSQTLNIESTFHTPRNNKYKNVNEILTSFHKNIYQFPKINKFIYGSKNPGKFFSKPKIKSKIDTNISN